MQSTGLVAQWIMRLATDQQIPGTNPGKLVTFEFVWIEMHVLPDNFSVQYSFSWLYQLIYFVQITLRLQVKYSFCSLGTIGKADGIIFVEDFYNKIVIWACSAMDINVCRLLC